MVAMTSSSSSYGGSGNSMRDQYRRQVDRISEEHMFLRKSVDRYLKRVDDSARQRELLLELGDPRENNNNNSGGGSLHARKRFGFLSGGGGPASLPMHVQEEEAYAQRMQQRQQQRQSLLSSIQLVEQMKQIGADIGVMLGEQGDVLRRARQQLWEVGSLLGLSQSTLRMIERRLTVDRWIVYVGMLVITLLLLFVWIYKLTSA